MEARLKLNKIILAAKTISFTSDVTSEMK